MSTQKQNMEARLTGLNQFLEDLYQRPRLLSDILSEHKYRKRDIRLLSDLYLEPFLNGFLNGLQSMLRELTNGERQSDIITQRYGLKSGEPRTLQEIAWDYGLSRERIRQLQAKALLRLRSEERVARLEELIVTVSGDILK